MSEDYKHNFMDSFDKVDEALKEYRAFMEYQAQFINEFIERIIVLTYKYFTAKSSWPHLQMHGEINEDVLEQNILADEDFKFYGIWIFEELNEIVIDYEGFKVPAGKKPDYKKIEYPSFTEETLEKQIKKFEKGCKNLNPEQRLTIRQSFKEMALINEFYTNFKIFIHKDLKKLALEYFPEIPEISGAGIREIDYMLYAYMLMIKGNIMKHLDDAVYVTVFPF